jgi:hypothetical protein
MKSNTVHNGNDPAFLSIISPTRPFGIARRQYLQPMLPLRILAGTLLAMTPLSGGAHIPAAPIREKGWDGPGHLCEPNFTFRVEQGEFVREDVQLELWQPSSNTIKSQNGWYYISTLHAKPADRKKLKLIKRFSFGELYVIDPVDVSFIKDSFVFISRSNAKPWIEISFIRLVQPHSTSPDWRVAPQGSIDPALYGAVLERMDFTNAPQADCLNH